MGNIFMIYLYCHNHTNKNTDQYTSRI